MKKFKKGFTLIELLVVIAIIGILSSIVLASLSTARNKGNDAKVKGEMASIRNAAEIYYGTNSNYGPGAYNNASCTGGMWSDATSGMSNLTSTGAYPDGTVPKCSTNGTISVGGYATAYAAWHVLSDGTSACVDSSGQSKTESSGFTVPAGGAGTTPVCP